MAERRAAFRHELTRQGAIVICEVSGYLDGPSSVRLFADVLREVKSRPERQIILYDAAMLDSFENAVIPEAQRSVRDVGGHVCGFVVVSGKAFVRFALSMVRLATPHQIAVFEQRAEALAWGAKTLRGELR